MTERPRQVRSSLRCVQCGYDLRGLSEGLNCPECGAPVEATTLAPILEASVAAANARTRLGRKSNVATRLLIIAAIAVMITVAVVAIVLSRPRAGAAGGGPGIVAPVQPTGPTTP